MLDDFNYNQAADDWQAKAIMDLPSDMRRILSVQFREFIHHIEDAQCDQEVRQSPRVIKFLEHCYKTAA